MKTSLRLASVLVPVVISAAAVAQTAPPVFDAGKALQETRPAPPSTQQREPDPIIIQQEETSLALPVGQTLMVKAFRFEGAEALPEADLQAAVADYVGRSLTMAEIEAAADRITALYRNRGYLVARAYVPRQDASGGTLTIQIVTGQYGKVSTHNQSLVRDGQIEGYFAGLARNKAVSRAELERAMLLVGDLPGASLPKVRIEPGSEQGTSDFNIEVEPGPRFNGYVLGDNYGSRYTGKNRLSLGASLNSPFSLGDRLDFSGMGSEDSGLLSGRFAYSAPLGHSGLRGELAVSNTTYELGSIYEPLEAKGRATSVEANFLYPILRTRSQNLNATLGLVSRKLRDEINVVDQVSTRHVVAATFGIAHERYGKLLGLDAHFSATGSLTWGHLKIDEADMKAANKAGADTVGDYGRVNLSLLGRLALTEQLSTSASISLQQSINRNLDSSEQLVISGTRGVMAFEDTVAGDNGYLFNVELRYALPSFVGVQHSVSAFFDSARITLHDADYTTGDGVTLNDVGLGYQVAWRSLFARAQVARVLGSWPSALPKDDRTRFLLQVGMAF
jgi:hemolysin activation/secretion protein